MDKSSKKNDKLTRPDAHFAEPKDVVADGSLSANEKSEVLDSLELDARLLDTAASEGMSGGELNKLYEVLQAKDHLAVGKKTKKI
jgi:Fe-S cluster assembly ATPase SufC